MDSRKTEAPTLDLAAPRGGWLERLFKLRLHGTTVKTELIAGLTTFITMAYIIFVNPNIMADAGIDHGAAFVATCIAAALGCLLMGLYANWPSTDEIIARITTSDLRALLPTLASGMIPKMEACLAAVEDGVPLATIVDGRQPHSLLLEIFTDEGVGTMVVPG